jgi:hypothetical protein
VHRVPTRPSGQMTARSLRDTLLDFIHTMSKEG